jgi:hypothetical protein
MATYQITAPSGEVFEITAPEGATEQQVLEYAQQQFASQTPAPQERSLGQEALRQLGLTARAGYEAFTGPAKAVLEAGGTAYNLLAPEGAPRAPSFYGAESQMLSSMGLPEPESMVERAVQTGTQAMLGTAGLARAAPNVPTVAAEMGRQIPASAAAGLVATPTAEVTKEVTGSDAAALLAAVGFGAVSASGTAKTIASISTGKTKVYTPQQIKQRADQSYRTMDESGISLKPESLNKLSSNIDKALGEARLIKGTTESVAIQARLDRVKEILGDGPASFTQLEEARKVLNDLRIDKDPNVRRLGGVAVAEVDNYLTSLSAKDLLAGQKKIGDAVKAVVSARKDWRNASRADILNDALETAEARALDPKASESELIRRGFINIASSPTKMKLFNKEEQNIIKSVASGGSVDKVLSFVARFNPQRSQLATAGTIVGATQSPAIAGSVATAGLGADVLQGVLRRRAAEQATKYIASGVPMRQPLDASGRGLFGGFYLPQNQEQ